MMPVPALSPLLQRPAVVAQGIRRIVPTGWALATLLAVACSDSGLPSAAESGATFACPCADGFECHPTAKLCVATGTVKLDAAEVQSDGSAAAEVVADTAAGVLSDTAADTAADAAEAGNDTQDAVAETADAGEDSAQTADSGEVAADGSDAEAAPDACQKSDESCNDKDDNCDGQTDEGCDDDGDDYCDSALKVSGKPAACPLSKVAKDGDPGDDCNDDPAKNGKQMAPGTAEVCDDIDNDCSSFADEGCDDDKDLFCDGKMSISGTPLVCPKGGNDCNDAVAAVNPGAMEACDGLDNNCGGGTDEGCGAEACNDKDDDKNGKTDEGCDDDGDGWCDAAMTTTGTPAICPNGGNDCNDVLKAINPAATEVCDNLDNNCKSGTDDGCDDDKDGYCDKTMQVVGTPAICTKAGSDCDDGAATVNPGAVEICDDADNDCDTFKDEGCDDDGDKYCDATMAVSAKGLPVCSSTTPVNGKGDDCNDDKTVGAAVNPGKKELCGNNVDDQCDGKTDEEGAVNCTATYADTDKDGYGSGASKCLCKAGDVADYTASAAGDCNDDPAKGGAAVHPNKGETCSNGIDDDCNGATDNCGPVGCGKDANGAACGNGKGTCFDGLCQHTDANGYKWTLVPAGKFWMGCNPVTDGECALIAAETPQHQIELSAYWIGVHEVTADQYKACLTAGANGCTAPKSGGEIPTYGVGGKAQHPINWVTRAQSQAVCKWLGGDLPTDAQWEKAARGGCELHAGKDCQASMPKYPWGNTEPTCGNEAAMTLAIKGCGTGATYAVSAGSAQGKSPYGAYDMAGNVYEFTLDWYEAGFYAKPEASAKDPLNSVANGKMTVRGGSIDHPPSAQRASHRGAGAETLASHDFGVRCAKPYVAPAETHCNNIDDNGDGATDEGCDDDNDDYCDAARTVVGKPAACPNSDGGSQTGKAGDDCNDTLANGAKINPGAPELCSDGIDNNCKAGIDEAACTVVLNAIGCPPKGSGASCGSGKGTCADGLCQHTDANGYKWTLVPAGKFWMGCNPALDSECATVASENPQHEVELSAYWIGVYEVTAEQYAKCVGAVASGCTVPKAGGEIPTYGVGAKGQHPINWVTRAQSQAACKWLGGDLPTDAQWEKAARGGCELYSGKNCLAAMPKYPWGNTEPTCGKEAVMALATKGCGTGATYAVGAGSALGKSPYGAYDMAGNVFEFTLDWFDAGFYAKPEATAKGPLNGVANGKLTIRGGSLDHPAATQRSSVRGGGQETLVSYDFGVRCAKPYVAPAETHCNNIDDNGDGATDEGCDDDNDDYCDSGMTVVSKPAACPNSDGGGNPGKAGDDCNDTAANGAPANPGLPDVCADGIDNNCKSGVDETGCVGVNTNGCPATGSGTSCGNGKGFCAKGLCQQLDAKGYKWTLVPAGKFWMGCNSTLDNKCQPSEKPQHEVDLSAYWIGVYEVTAAQYAACVAAGASGCSAASSVGLATYGVVGKEQHPINYVNYAQSKAYCGWLGGTLPTEAQWERAARGGCEVYAGKDCKTSEAKYPWGSVDPTCGVHAMMGQAPNCNGTTTAAVGTASPLGASPYGAYDMAGNVFEWMLDVHDASYFGKAAATAKDPVNPYIAGFKFAIRGGSFYSDALWMRGSMRSGYQPETQQQEALGMRCAKPAP